MAAGLKCSADREEASGGLKQRRLNISRSWALKAGRIWTGRWQGAGFHGQVRLGGWDGKGVGMAGGNGGGGGRRCLRVAKSVWLG